MKVVWAFGCAVGVIALFAPSPAFACASCSPEDLRFLAILVGIGLGSWGTFLLFKWTSKRFFQQPDVEMSDD